MDDLRRELLTEEQLAALLRKDPRTLRRWRQLRIGPPWVPLGRSVVYLSSAVLRWLGDCQVATDAAGEGRGA